MLQLFTIPFASVTFDRHFCRYHSVCFFSSVCSPAATVGERGACEPGHEPNHREGRALEPEGGQAGAERVGAGIEHVVGERGGGDEAAAATPAVGATRCMRTKLRMDPTTTVEKTKSSFEVEVGVGGHVAEHAGSDADELLHVSMSTLNGNCRSAATRAAQPARKTSRMPPAVAFADAGVCGVARSAAAVRARGRRQPASRAGRRRGSEAEE